MNQTITITEKKMFLQWFLKKYELKKRECAWLLTYLLSDDDLIENVRFVDELPTHNQRAMFMSTKCVNDHAFRFMKGKLVTTDVERAFHDIRLHPEEDILIMLSFNQSETCAEYAAVREVDPMERYNVTSNSWYSLLAEMVLDEAIERFQKEKLYQQINQSLEENDRERFLQLSRRWTELHAEE